MGVVQLKGNIEQRVSDLAAYIVEQDATVRAAAKKFGVSKSTVHKDMTQRLGEIDHTLFLAVKDVLERNKAQRHLRGGMATKAKYESKKR